MNRKTVLSILFLIGFMTNSAFAQSLEVVARIMPPDPDMSGIAVTGGRVFLGFPRHADNHKGCALAELKNGKLIPFPNKEMTYPSNRPYKDWLVSPHGMTTDSKGNIWVVDDGKRAGIDGIPEGAAKVVCFATSGKVLASIPISTPVLRQDMHLNDLRVDLKHGKKGTVYIANSSFGTTPSLLVVDIASGKSREVLENHYSTGIQKGYVAFLEGEARAYHPNNITLPSGGADGIALIGNRLFWTSITGRGLYSISTDSLSDFSISEGDLERVVRYEGDRPSCDGLAEDSDGNIYFSAYEQMALVKRTPDGQFKTIVRDKRLGWPDGLACTSDGYLYATVGQWNRLPGFNGGKDLRRPPYLVVRVKLK
ncbi:major royal jelly family protein [Prevotella cerevisiae]|uniref:Major royal jelly family protein n=1 Tax=Segatella cerevisiae TaxID=2053716 RepID=A0ABT1BU97_9BACT|nr:major royal jelly family protein [Segatella cerevisiae]MCO6024666.1 major royal jelly family protein [Segatella cerevisiae]